MATCANCIHHSLCDYNTNVSGNGKIRLVYAEGSEKCSFFQNTADVVPKSKSEFDSIPVEVAQVLKDKAVEKAKAEVAREIFEELDKRLDKVCIVANRETEYNSFIGVVQQVFDAVGVVLSELKKKYTEDA